MTDAATILRSHLQPRVGIVLGSGLGAVADAVEDAVTIGYDELPGFPKPGVAGHAGRAVVGRLQGVPTSNRVEGGADVLLQLAGDPPGDEGQRGPDEQQADDDLRREADGEDVELGHDARDDAERGVGENQREHDRAGDLDRRGHDPGEARVDGADESAEIRRLVEPDEVIGAGEPAHDPAVAADDDEDDRADKPVELGEHRRLVAGERVDEAAVGEPDRGVEQRAR